MLDFRVNTFLEVCEYMNYTKAAEKLHITQPAVSQHIHFLETEFGQKLFLYEGKKLQLTAAGTALYQAAITMKSDVSLLKETMQRGQTQQMDIYLGATLTIGEFVIAKHLKHLMTEYPAANFHLTVANTSELIGKLKNNEIQFALVEGSFSKAEFDSMVYFDERFILVCSASHHFAKKEPKQLNDLLPECVIAREIGSGNREILDSYLRLQNLSLSDFSHFIEVNGMHAIKSMVLADCGVAFLYKTAVREELNAGLIREIALTDFQISHSFYFIWNKNSIYTNIYRHICETLMQG